MYRQHGLERPCHGRGHGECHRDERRRLTIAYSTAPDIAAPKYAPRIGRSPGRTLWSTAAAVIASAPVTTASTGRTAPRRRTIPKQRTGKNPAAGSITPRHAA